MDNYLHLMVTFYKRYVELQDQMKGPYFVFLKSHISTQRNQMYLQYYCIAILISEMVILLVVSSPRYLVGGLLGSLSSPR